MKKSSFLTFCFAFIPGAGQMYLGYMKRGLSLMFSLFCLCCMSWIIPLFAWFIPLVWFVAFFDTFNLAGKIRIGVYDDDTSIFADYGISNIFSTVFKKRNNLNKIIGYSAIAVGGYLAYQELLLPLIHTFTNAMYEHNAYISDTIAGIFNRVPAMAISIVIIIVGVKLLKGPTKKVAPEFVEFNADTANQPDEMGYQDDK